MPFVDTNEIEVIERLPGCEHFHSQEEVYEAIKGQLDLTIDGVTRIARPGLVGMVPAHVRH